MIDLYSVFAILLRNFLGHTHRHHVCGMGFAKYDLPRFVGLTFMKVTIMTMQSNTINISGNAAIAAALADYASQSHGETVGAALVALRVAKFNVKTIGADLFRGLLMLAASGASPEAIRAAGKRISADVGAILKNGGFVNDNGKPLTWSTPTGYASAIANIFGAYESEYETYAAALDRVNGDREGLGITVNDQGIPSQASNAVLLSGAIGKVREANQAAAYPALVPTVPETVEQLLAAVTIDRDSLAQSSEAMSSELASMRVSNAKVHSDFEALRALVATLTTERDAARLELVQVREAMASAPVAKSTKPVKPVTV